jgi:hypothetical protein
MATGGYTTGTAGIWSYDTSTYDTTACFCVVDVIADEPATKAPPPKLTPRFPAPFAIAERTRPEWVAQKQRTAARCRR